MSRLVYRELNTLHAGDVFARSLPFHTALAPSTTVVVISAPNGTVLRIPLAPGMATFRLTAEQIQQIMPEGYGVIQTEVIVDP
jgi:hypothetical protein